MKKISTRGGKREGAGRKRLGDELYVSVHFRVPEGAAEEVRQIVKAFIAYYRVQKGIISQKRL